MNSAENYLAELDRCLARHLSPDLRRSRVEEIRTHLDMDQMDRQAAGADVDTASRAARQALGSPSVLARQMVRQDRGYDSAPLVRLTWPCGLALILAMAIPFYVHSFPAYPWGNHAVRWLPFLVLAYFGLLVLRTRRWLARPMALWSALAFIGIWAAQVLPSNAVYVDGTSQVLGLREMIRQVGIEERSVAAWRSGHTPADRAPVPQQEIHSAFYFPLIPFDVPRSKKTLYSVTDVGPGQAPRLWAANGPAYADDVESRLGRLQVALDSAEHPLAARLSSLPRVLPAVVELTVAQTAIFAGVNWALLALSTAALRRRTRRDPLLA